MPPKRILVVAESINVDDSSGSKANVAIIHNLKKAAGINYWSYITPEKILARWCRMPKYRRKQKLFKFFSKQNSTKITTLVQLKPGEIFGTGIRF